MLPVQKTFLTLLGVFVVLTLPAAAHAAGFFNVNIANLSGCIANAFGSSCNEADQKLFATIACKVMKTIDSAIIPLFCNITQNQVYLRFLDGALMLYVLIFGISFVSGATQVKLGTAIFAIAKAAIIYALMTNADFFFNFVYYTVVDTPQQLIKTILQVHGSSADNIFEYVDEGMYKVLSQITQPDLNPADRQSYIAKELAIVGIALGVKSLLPGGNFIYGLFMFVVMGWLFSYLSIVVRYLLAYLALVFMLMLMPIFLPSLLFRKTTFLWDEYIKQIITFVLEIIIVVSFVLMIEQFYIEFYEMLKKSFEHLKLEQQDTTYLRSYNVGEDTNFVKEESVKGIKDPVSSLNKAGFSGNATQISTQLLIDLITMGVIIFLSSVFLRYIPQFAAQIAGQYNFSKLFGGENISQKATASRTNLFGQDGYKGKQDATTPDADRPGGIWGDFVSGLNPLN